MPCRDAYGYALTTSPEAAAAYDRGLGDLLRLRAGGSAAVATAVALDPTFAIGHATLALLGHEMCLAVDLDARLRDAEPHAGRGAERGAQSRARRRRAHPRRLPSAAPAPARPPA